MARLLGVAAFLIATAFATASARADTIDIHGAFFIDNPSATHDGNITTIGGQETYDITLNDVTYTQETRGHGREATQETVVHAISISVAFGGADASILQSEIGSSIAYGGDDAVDPTDPTAFMEFDSNGEVDVYLWSLPPSQDGAKRIEIGAFDEAGFATDDDGFPIPSAFTQDNSGITIWDDLLGIQTSSSGSASDNTFSLTFGAGNAVVPEPATVALLGLGAIAGLARRRK